MRATTKPQVNRPMYVVPRSDEDWLLNVQQTLYARSMDNPDYVFRKLWGLVTDERNLRIAVARVARNRGRRTAGVGGLTLRMVLRNGVDAFVADARVELRSGAYRPSPVRRVLIPKRGQPGKFRGLGIPTVRDRVASPQASRTPALAESPMRNERRTSGSGMGAAETSAGNRATAPPSHFH